MLFFVERHDSISFVLFCAKLKSKLFGGVPVCFLKHKDYGRRFHNVVGHLVFSLFVYVSLKKYDTIISHMPNSKFTLGGRHRNINDHFTQVCALFFSKLVIKAKQVSTNV